MVKKRMFVTHEVSRKVVIYAVQNVSESSVLPETNFMPPVLGGGVLYTRSLSFERKCEIIFPKVAGTMFQ